MYIICYLNIGGLFNVSIGWRLSLNALAVFSKTSEKNWLEICGKQFDCKRWNKLYRAYLKSYTLFWKKEAKYVEADSAFKLSE